MLKVLKFGGTSVGTLDRIANVAQIIKKIRDEGHDVIAIVSAMSGETNKLIEYAEYYTKTPELKEMDMLLNYSIPQVKGLFVFAVYANQWLPEQNPNGSNAWTSELGVFYTY